MGETKIIIFSVVSQSQEDEFDQCFAQFPDKFPPATDRNKYRDPQSESRQRVREIGTLRPK